MIRGLDSIAKQYKIPVTEEINSPPVNHKTAFQDNQREIPMMYRAQVMGRCSLQNAGNNTDLDKWTKEWISSDYGKNEQPTYQHEKPKLGFDGSTYYRLEVKFPFRVFSNCGQDSILRPVIGKDGIPYIPGSSIKGLFKRLLNTSLSQKRPERQDRINRYCGTKEKPGILRFHGAFPVGDWASTEEITYQKHGKQVFETRYRMVDLVHPQQDKQIKRDCKTSANAAISFYQPTLIFELSSREKLEEEEWKGIEGLLKEALRPGVGGKTSSGYGLCYIPQQKYPISIMLKGVGVSSLLRNNQPEFRPNMFKAVLRGHVTRLLAGVCNDKRQVESKVDQLFGSTKTSGKVKIYWESRPNFPKYGKQGKEQTPSYEIEGNLCLDTLDPQDTPHDQDLQLLKLAIEFAYTMGGFGKSWRRIWHTTFMPSYKKRGIGCHWEGEFSFLQGLEKNVIENPQNLSDFLKQTYKFCQNYMNCQSSDRYLQNWREAWNPNKVQVWSRIANNKNSSLAIKWFHDNYSKNNTIKQSSLTGQIIDKKLRTGCIWHRMYLLNNGQYLEILTVFRDDVQKNIYSQTAQNFITYLNKRTDFELVFGK